MTRSLSGSLRPAWRVNVTLAACALFLLPTLRPASAQSYAELEARVGQLEQQLVDMQVVIGTLESLARAGGGAPQPAYPTGPVASTGALSGDAAARLAVVETQILALSGQLQRLEAQLSAGGAAAAAGGFSSPSTNSGFGSFDTGDSNGFATEVAPADPNAFGSNTVAPDIDTSFGADTSVLTAAVGPSADPHEAYKEAYGHLLRQDYGAAEEAFRGFLDTHGDHELAGNAQFWLGETYYVRGEYRTAAEAFLSGYSSDRTGPKAAESLLKLAMSLSRLELKRDACATFTEFDQQFPSAEGRLRQRADNERRRAGC